MQYKTLGDTGLLVSTLCFGTMTFHGGAGRFRAVGQVDQAGADQLVKTSLDAGINFFDTADVYSEGESEKTLGNALKNLDTARKDVVIATKVFGRVGPGRNDIGASRAHIMDSIDGSLKRLRTDYIDLYQIHGNDSITPIDETLRALDDLGIGERGLLLRENDVGRDADRRLLQQQLQQRRRFRAIHVDHDQQDGADSLCRALSGRFRHGDVNRDGPHGLKHVPEKHALGL